MKIIFGTVIYEAGIIYFKNYIESLISQSYPTFRLLLINQDINDLNNIKKLIPESVSYQIENAPNDFVSTENIIFLINIAFSINADILIFGDMDDYFHPKRVEIIVNKMEDNVFLYHDLLLVNQKGIPTSQESLFLNQNIPCSLNNPIQLINYNIVGLSNSAISIQKIRKNIFDNITYKGLIAADWFIFTLLLEHGYTGQFINKALSYYRQHTNNTIGGTFNQQKIQLGIDTKLAHYKQLSNKNDKYEKYYLKMKKLSLLFNTDDKFRQSYLKMISEKFSNKKLLWWENIILI